MDPNAGPPPFPDVNRGPRVLALVWTEVSIAILVVGLRFATRISNKHIGIDDWLMGLALLFFIALASSLTHLADIGGFRHLAFLTPPEIVQVIFWQLPIETVGIISFIPSKISVAALILRIISPTGAWRRYFLYFICATVVLFNSLNAIFVWTQCEPVAATWNPMVPGKCWNPQVLVRFATFNGVYNILVDATLALLPATFLWQLNIPTKKRVEVTCLMALGLFAAVCGSVKAAYLGTITAKSDLGWVAFPLHCWSATETFVIIVAGSIPPLRSLWDRYVTSRIGSSGAAGSETRVNSGKQLWSPLKGSSSSYASANAIRTDSISKGVYASDLSASGSETGVGRITTITDIVVESQHKDSSEKV